MIDYKPKSYQMALIEALLKDSDDAVRGLSSKKLMA